MISSGRTRETTSLFKWLKRSYHRHPGFLVNLIAKTTFARSSKHATQIHALLVASDFISCPVFFTKLLSLYFKCGLVEKSICLFSSAPCSSKNVVAWTALISQLTHVNECFKASTFFHQMRSSDACPNEYTFSAVLQACSGLRAIDIGEQVHCLTCKYGFGAYLFVGSTLIDMYSKCDKIASSQLVFAEMRNRNLVSWNAMMVGYLQNECFYNAIRLFKDLLYEDPELLIPDEVSFSSVLSACANSGALAYGRQVHGLAIKHDLTDLTYVKSSLLDMYCKSGMLSNAIALFKLVDLVSCNVMLAGFYMNGKHDEAVSLFCAMIGEGILPDEASFCCALRATGGLGVLFQGIPIHGNLIKSGFLCSVFVSASLIMMYAACGSLTRAYQVFKEVEDRNLVCWTAIIVASQQHGFPKQAIYFFEEMLIQQVKPSHAAYASVITACSDLNSMVEGISYLNAMTEVHEMNLDHQHYASMVELLCRSGCINEALEIIKFMPTEHGSELWCTLLRACLEHRNLEIGKEAVGNVLQLEPGNHGNYLLLSQLYGLTGRAKTYRVIIQLPEYSWIELRSSVFVFSEFDQKKDEIRQILKTLAQICQCSPEDRRDPTKDTQYYSI